MKADKQKKTVSLVEVLVAIVIIALTAGGLEAVFFNARSYIRHSNERSVAAILAFSFIQDLYNDVRADIWNTGGLAVQTTSLPSYTVDNIDYGGPNTEYQITNVPVYNYRRADITIEYPD